MNPTVQSQYQNALQQWQTSFGDQNINGTVVPGYISQGIPTQQVVDDFVNYWSSQGVDSNTLQTDVTGVLQNVGVYPSTSGGGGGGSSTGGGTSAPAIDQNAIAAYNDQIQGFNNSIDLLQPALDTQIGNFDSARNDQINNVERDFGLAERDFNTRRGQTIEDRTTAANNSISGTASRLNAIQRLLGAAGAGNSSAATILAPQISARAGSRDLFGIGRTFARNLGSLTQAFEDTEQNRLQVLDDIQQAYDINVRNARADSNLTRAGLLDDRRTASINRDIEGGTSYADAVARYAGDQRTIDQLLRDATSLGANPAVPQIGRVDFAAPNLEQFTLGSGGRLQVDTPQTTGVNPLLLPIITQEEERL